MISRDQPTLLGSGVIAAVSSVDDGTMSFRGNDPEEIRSNRIAFLEKAGIEPLQSTLLQVSYEEGASFTAYTVVDDEYIGEGMLEPGSDGVADAMVVTRPEQAIFLPLADCAGAVIYDPVNRVLMVSHLGRHSLEANGGQKSIEYLVREFDSTPGDLLVWLSPAVGKSSYPLRVFNGRSIHEVTVQQLLTAGVQPNNIEISAVDTAESDDYFSHSEFLADNRSEDGRFAIVAMMIE